MQIEREEKVRLPDVAKCAVIAKVAPVTNGTRLPATRVFVEPRPTVFDHGMVRNKHHLRWVYAALAAVGFTYEGKVWWSDMAGGTRDSGGFVLANTLYNGDDVVTEVKVVAVTEVKVVAP